MAILIVRSSNQNLSFAIQKNPAAGMAIKPVKMGMMFGYFPTKDGKQQTNAYVIYFKDASDRITYKVHPDEQFEYLNSSKYNDARFINDAIQEMLHAAREGKGDSAAYDVPANQSVSINLVNTDFKTIDIFRRYFTDVEIRSEEVSRNNFKLDFVSEKKMTLQYMLRVVNLFGIFAQLNSPTYSYLTEDLVKKYVRIASEVDAPYFVRYLIKMRMCRGEKIFDSVKDELSKSDRYEIILRQGDSHQMRMNWVSRNLDLDHSIIDIGCGIDCRYLKMLAPKLKEKGLSYYAIEIDPEARERVSHVIRNKDLEDTVELYPSLDEFMKYHDEYLSKETFNILCTEVLEHNEWSEARRIVKTVINRIKREKFIVTLPNFEFNRFYELGGKFRHDDHKWEATMDEIATIWPGDLSYTCIRVDGVGDCVDRIPVSIGIIVYNSVFKKENTDNVMVDLQDYLSIQ